MAYESAAEPIKLGYLFDFVLPDAFPKEMRADLTQSFRAGLREGLEQGIIDRPIEIVFREVEGLPKGSVKAVIDAYGELVDEGCLAVFGPSITDNCVPTKEAIEKRFQVPAISVTGTDDWLGEWTFSLPQGSMTDEPVFWAHLLAKRGLNDVGVLVEQSLVGETYIRSFPPACRDTASASPPRSRLRRPPRTSVSSEEVARRQGGSLGALRLRLRRRPDQSVLPELAWDPPRFMGTSFQNAWINPIVWDAIVGWIGVDQFDEGNEVGQAIHRSLRRTLWLASGVLRSGRQPRSRNGPAPRLRRRAALVAAGREGCTGTDPMLPAASGSPGTRISFGNWTHRGWMGAGYLVARRLDPDGTSAHLVERFGQG